MNPPPRNLLIGAGLLLVGFLLVAAGFAAFAEEERGDALLPDLRTLPPEDFRIEDEEENAKVLRFANTVWNAGEGPLEVRGETDTLAEETRVIQVLHFGEGAVEEREVGEFTFHPDHDHWHMEDFALYELLSLTPEGETGSVVASSGKISFCLTENRRVDGDLINGESDYGGCGEDTQGISPGWGDTYGANLSGQELNIETVPDGEYALRSVADPENRLAEADDGNNEAIVYLEINGDEVEEVEAPS